MRVSSFCQVYRICVALTAICSFRRSTFVRRAVAKRVVDSLTGIHQRWCERASFQRSQKTYDVVAAAENSRNA
jgi:hypothetical protein